MGLFGLVDQHGSFISLRSISAAVVPMAIGLNAHLIGVEVKTSVALIALVFLVIGSGDIRALQWEVALLMKVPFPSKQIKQPTSAMALLVCRGSSSLGSAA